VQKLSHRCYLQHNPHPAIFHWHQHAPM